MQDDKKLYARSCYSSQKYGAKKRNIDWKFNFQEWYNWWLSNGVDRNIKRKIVKDSLCMCRKNDIGPYSIDNVYCATISENSKHEHLNVSYKMNYLTSGGRSSKKTVTPLGVFETQWQAGQAHGVINQTIGRWIRNKKEGFYYA